MTWPATMWREDKPMAFKKTIHEAAFFGSYTYYFAKIFVTTMLADAWTYWKHRSLHHPCIYACHKDHHVYHNPSTYAGYAIHPVEAVFTFCPILLFTFP